MIRMTAREEIVAPVIMLTSPGFEPWVIMVLPPGGFFTLAFVLLTVAWARQRRAARAAAAGRDAAVARRAA